MDGREKKEKNIMHHEWSSVCMPDLLTLPQKHTHKPILKNWLHTRPPAVGLYMQLLPVNKLEEAA